MDTKNLSSNWKKLQASGKVQKPETSTLTARIKALQTPNGDASLKRKRYENSERIGQPPKRQIPNRYGRMSADQLGAKNIPVSNGNLEGNAADRNAGNRVNEGLAKNVDLGKYVALDCEMVGVGPNPRLESALARVSIVDYNGDQVYDSYVKPQEEVTDWRTHVSGIAPKHMIHARSFEEVQADIASLLKGRIVVGHSVRGDFEALFLDHPKRDIRDTARHPPYRKLAGGGSPKLKILASELLGLNIQAGEHSSVEDARATMLLFRRDKDAFEAEHIKKWGLPTPIKKAGGDVADANAAKKPKKKKKKRR